MEDDDKNESDVLRFFNSETRCLSFYAENGFPDDYRIFQECLDEHGRLRFGQWDYLTVLAWVGSRDEAFTAGVQRFCNQQSISPYRGGSFWGAARIMVSGAMSKASSSASYDEAVVDLREALEGNLLKGTALREKDGARATISGDEWRAGFGEVSHHNSFSLVEGYRDHLWLSHDVVAAFPGKGISSTNALPPAPVRVKATCTDAEILTRCDALWLDGSNVRDMEKCIPDEPQFLGIKAERIRDLTTGRYPRTGRGDRKPEHIPR